MLRMIKAKGCLESTIVISGHLLKKSVKGIQLGG